MLLLPDSIRFAALQTICAPLAELVDARDSKSRSFGSAGSIPAGGTTPLLRKSIADFAFLSLMAGPVGMKVVDHDFMDMCLAMAIMAFLKVWMIRRQVVMVMLDIRDIRAGP